VLATPRSHDRRMGVALLVVTVLAGALEVAKARRYPFNAREGYRRNASLTCTAPVGPHRIQVADGTPHAQAAN
jgi:hypothetical protein